ncbi:MAG: translation initiation factor IF-3 [Candidatus Levybacteria bacterium]|nr:translation initiation factor IF-3 [Candidatus Levybacteria bacterium]
MIKRHKRSQDQKRFYRVNERISARELRVLDSEGKQIGILDRFAALQNAREQGLDLVEIAPRAIPPVAKIVDFNKFLYQEEKRKREEKKKAKVSETKEVRLGPFISDNDLGVMVKRAREFLLEGDKVRFVVKFRGRQVTRPEFGFATARKAIAMLEDISKVEREPHMEGRQLVAIISFERKKHEKKAENEKSSSQTV